MQYFSQGVNVVGSILGYNTENKTKDIRDFIKMQGYTITLSDKQLLDIIKGFYKEILLNVLNDSTQTYEPDRNNAQKYLKEFQNIIFNIVNSSIKDNDKKKKIVDMNALNEYTEGAGIASLTIFSKEFSSFVGSIQKIIEKTPFILNDYFLGDELRLACSRFLRVAQEDLKGKVLTIFRLRDKHEKAKTLIQIDTRTNLLEASSEIFQELADKKGVPAGFISHAGPYFSVASGGSEQDAIYKSIQSTLDLPQYHCILFGYGASGSGKTYTLFGTEEHPGIVRRFLLNSENINKGSIKTNIFRISLFRGDVNKNARKITVEYTVRRAKVVEKSKYLDMLDLEGSSNTTPPSFEEDRITFEELFNRIKNYKSDNYIKWTPNNSKSTRGVVVFEYEFERLTTNRTTKKGRMTVVDLPGIENFASGEILGYLKKTQNLQVEYTTTSHTVTQNITHTKKKAGAEKGKYTEINLSSLLVGAKNNETRAKLHREIIKKEAEIDMKRDTFMNIETLLNLQAESMWINTFTKADGHIAKFLKSRQKGGTPYKGLYYKNDENRLFTIENFPDYLTGRERDNDAKSGGERLKSKFIMIATAFNPSLRNSTNVQINRIKSEGAVQTLKFSHEFASTSSILSTTTTTGDGRRTPLTDAPKMSKLMENILKENKIIQSN